MENYRNQNNLTQSSAEVTDSENLQLKKKDKYKETLFLASVTGFTAVITFCSALAIARRKDPVFFNKGIAVTKESEETGPQLALRALKYGTLCAFTGCGLIFYGIWKLSGASNMQEFRTRMGEMLPRISRDKPPQGRTDFENFKDLFNYLETEYSRKKNQ